VGVERGEAELRLGVQLGQHALERLRTFVGEHGPFALRGALEQFLLPADTLYPGLDSLDVPCEHEVVVQRGDTPALGRDAYLDALVFLDAAAVLRQAAADGLHEHAQQPAPSLYGEGAGEGELLLRRALLLGQVPE